MKVLLPAILLLATLIGSGEVIHACVARDDGAVRIVAQGEVCHDDEVAVEWGVVGLQGPQEDTELDIYMMNADGSNQTPIITGPRDDTQPAW